MMKKTLITLVAWLLLPLAATHGVEVGTLRCEYLKDPLGVDVAKPRLSWKLETEDLKPERGIKQAAYQILVASTPEILAKDQGDLWDSGEVSSDRSIQVEYAGKPLDSGMRYYWKVRVWDREGEASDWSQPAQWLMGKLKPEDWTAKWIAMKVDDGLPHPWMRRTFEVDSEVKDAVVYVNTPSHYELYINGQKVGNDVLAPAHASLEKRFLYNAYDVTKLLHRGKNCIALWMGPGWYQPRYGNPHKSPIVRVQLEILGSGGNKTVIGSDTEWRVADSCISQIGNWAWNDMGGERWDDAKYIKDWNQVAFDDSSWANAVEVPAPAVENSWQAQPGSKLGLSIAPAKIYEHNGKWVVDFGTTLTGWMRMRFSGLQPGQQVSIIYADSNNPAMNHVGTPDGFQSFRQEDAFIAGPSGSGEFCSKFNQHAFRYAVISGLPKAPGPKDVEAMMVETDLQPVGEFSCSNELFNQIHQVTVRTYRTQTPCGVLGGGEAREKLGYGDGGSFLTGFLYNLGSDAFYKKWLRDWCDGQTEKGFLGHTAPEYYPAGGGPSWGGQASELTRRLDLYFGDTRAIESAYPVLKKYVDHLESHTDKDILRYFNPYNPYNPGKYIQWYFLGDWNPPAESQDKRGFIMETPEQREFFNNCYRILLWQDLANFAQRLGDTVEQKRCEERLAVLRPLVHKSFFDPEKNTYRVNRQAYLVIALRARIMPEELRPVIFKQLEHNIVVEKKGHLDCGLQGSYMLLDLLAQENRPDLAALIMGQETYPGWGFLLKERQVTTWPESWTGWGSQIIQVVATPGAWFYEGFAGIRPDPAHPGFKHFSIHPGIVDSVDWVNCHHDSPHGRIASNWQREGEKLTMDVTIPPNTTATIFVPAKDAASVTESGKPAGEAEGVKFLRMENNAAVFAVGSGNYQFQSQHSL